MAKTITVYTSNNCSYCVMVKKYLDMNTNNIVIHPSELPLGRGWSPVAWQVLEGKNEIPITLFEAESKIDSGIIYYEDKIILNGKELIDEIRFKQGNKTVELILRFVKNVKNTFEFEYEILFETNKDQRSKVFDFAHENELKIINLQHKNETLEGFFKNLT